MADDKKVITVNLSMFGQDAAAKTARFTLDSNTQ